MSGLSVPGFQSATGATAAIYAQIKKTGCRGKEAAQFFRGSFRNFLGKEMAGIERSATDIEGAFSMARWGP